jgi:hypothetical protein
MLISPRFLRQRIQVYDELCRAGYTELVVYMAQQIQQFRRLGKEFAMQHLGAEDEMLQTLQDLFASLPVEERLQCLTTEERLWGLSLEERLSGLSPKQRRRAFLHGLIGLTPEDRIKRLTCEEREHLLELVEQRLADLHSDPE